jgi:hypothetical protein
MCLSSAPTSPSRCRARMIQHLPFAQRIDVVASVGFQELTLHPLSTASEGISR